MAYWVLLLSAFGSATLLPMQSEAVLVGLLARHQYHDALLILCAGIGNVAGSCVNFWLGQRIERYHQKSWFPVSDKQLDKAKLYYDKLGYWSLLASWVPVIGDPITLLAGILGERFWRFLLLVTIAKFGRYLMLFIIFRYIG